jgi:hypothetical protein
MPKIYEYLGFIFFLYSNDHEPLHVHVRYGEYESIIELGISNSELVNVKFKKSKGNKPIPDVYRKELYKFVSVYYLKIVEKWTQFYLLKTEPKNEKISTRIR